MRNTRRDHINEGYRKAQQAAEAASQRRTDNAIELLADSLQNLFVVLRSEESNDRRRRDAGDPHDYVGEP